MKLESGSRKYYKIIEKKTNMSKEQGIKMTQTSSFINNNILFSHFLITVCSLEMLK